ncbi:MAG: hypothetical protein HYR84_00475 [Planctomycetes bacterium]|nr:hypothetical protein [Planctomycetota bacterium]
MMTSPFRIASFTLALLIALTSSWAQEKTIDGPTEIPKKSVAPPVGAVEVWLTDESTMKVQLRDERIELETAYSQLLIPIADIQRIDVGLRVSESVRKRIDLAMVDPASTDFRRRQAATTELLSFTEKGYPFLLQAARGKDAETVRRIDEIVDKIRETVAAEILDIPPYDVVHTADSKIAGRIKADTLRVGTLAFGDQPIKLTDIRSLRSQNAREPDAPVDGALVDAGALRMFQNQIGKTLVFKLTGPPPALGAQQGVYGTDVYTMDSSLEAAAVHAGVLQPGKTGIVRVTILGPQPGFVASLRNGIASHGYGPWPGFRIEQPKNGPRR